MKKCRYCKSEIDPKAKICPNCRKKQLNPFVRSICIFIGIIFIIAGISSLANDTNNNNNSDDKECYMTMELFNKIENNMTYDEVKNIIGCDGSLSSETSYDTSNMKTYYWYAKNGISNATFSFINDKLNGKAQIGLE